MTASLGGINVLVFTRGVGEGSVEIRHRSVEGLSHPGREDRQMVREARELLRGT